MTDWGEGDYERTAKGIMPAAENVIVQADVQPGARLLDVACGTGNALLLAAARGAEVTGIDLAPRLVEIARRKLQQAELPGTIDVGDATDLPYEDDSFDATVSVFGVMFAPAEKGAAELRRVTKAGGQIVITSWAPGGLIGNLGMAMRKRLQTEPPPPPPPGTDWSNPDDLATLLPGAHVTKHPIAFTAPSPDAWWDEYVANHPPFYEARQQLERRGEWADFDREARAMLADGNEDPSAFRTTSEYWMAHVRG